MSDVAQVIDRNEDSSWALKVDTIRLAGLADCRCVHDGHDLFRVVAKDSIEEFLVPVLQLSKIHVLVDRLLESAQVRHGGPCLERLRSDGRWQKASEAIFLAFL